MVPVDFFGSNCTYAKDQPEYLPLPAHRTAGGWVTSCWKLTLRERIKVLFTGRVFLTVATFNKPLQPQILSVTGLTKGFMET